MPNIKPNAENKNLRSCGGHLHLGYFRPKSFVKDGYKGDEERMAIVKVMDLFIGVPSVIMEPDNKRKELYGKAGCYRPKKYGLEYRTVSNFYLQSKGMTEWAFDATMAATNHINESGYLDNELSLFIEKTINNNNKEAANYLINTFNLKLAA